jgi:hypothetical protein
MKHHNTALRVKLKDTVESFRFSVFQHVFHVSDGFGGDGWSPSGLVVMRVWGRVLEDETRLSAYRIKSGSVVNVQVYSGSVPLAM